MWLKACATACAGFTEGTEGMTSGDTAWCRVYHTEFAGTFQANSANRTTHCGHGGEVPTSQCQ